MPLEKGRESDPEQKAILPPYRWKPVVASLCLVPTQLWLLKYRVVAKAMSRPNIRQQVNIDTSVHLLIHTATCRLSK